MHELSLARALLRQVDELRASRGCGAVQAVRVSIGEFSGVDAELLQLAFERSADGDWLAGTALQVERVALEARCRACGQEFAVRGFRFVCPACGGHATDVLRGEELMLESVTFAEVEQ